MQSEYIQLCKTLYTLLQGSADEQELFDGMARVAKSLLSLGGADCSCPDSIGQCGDTGRGSPKCTDSDGSLANAQTHQERAETRESDTDNVSSSAINSEVAAKSLSEEVVSSSSCFRNEQAEFSGGVEGRILSSVVNSEASSTGRATSEVLSSSCAQKQHKHAVDSEKNDKELSSVVTLEAAAESLSVEVPKEADEDKMLPSAVPAGSLIKGAQPSSCVCSGCEGFEHAMVNTVEPKVKWLLTFEQFVSTLQKEPVLCQFFAEQNTIDLSGTSVDPVLNPYTRTILATSLP